MKLRRYVWIVACLFVLVRLVSFSESQASAHIGTAPSNHGKKAMVVSPESAADPFEKINQDYKNSVKPIFQAKCFNCHSGQTNWPWYHSIPGITQALEKDVAEGRKHLDMSDDFPFGGHGSPLEDLDAIEKVVNEGTMPPIKYLAFHWKSMLSESDKAAIRTWIQKSRSFLKEMGVEEESEAASGHH